MRQLPARTVVLVMVLCALVLPAGLLQADTGAELQKNLLAATVKERANRVPSTTCQGSRAAITAS